MRLDTCKSPPPPKDRLPETSIFSNNLGGKNLVRFSLTRGPVNVQSFLIVIVSANCSQLLCFCLDKVKTCATSLGLHAGAVFPLAVVRRENFFKQSLLSYHCHFQIMATRVRKDGIRQERDTFSPLFKVSSARSIALKPHRLICLCH